ncbi:MAG: 4Fe-4S binding protein [Bacilli bacterium]|jgi:UDP-glucose 4-epimerase|nr:4Fe-4S binding protein [Bacilli bacterium]MDD3348865.1 4Fe-4S binding protein [Bacilli bacterium]MDD4056989.1 4Fe-4S binding protein [Bacilli bacterium]MDY0209395.1 4Fe-4S binding protein [Bacilli bacterium]
MKAYVDQQECIGCAQCLDSCPVNAIHLESGKAEISDECIGCGRCIDKCPVKAISVK